MRQTEDRLARVATLLEEIEKEAGALVDGARGASAIAIVARAAAARLLLDEFVGAPAQSSPLAEMVQSDLARRVRRGVAELGISTAAAANLMGLTESEVRGLVGGDASGLSLDLLEQAARKLESEQQLSVDVLG